MQRNLRIQTNPDSWNLQIGELEFGIRNISLGGFLAIGEHPLGEEGSVPFRLVAPGHELVSGEASVRWHNSAEKNSHGLGLKIDNLRVGHDSHWHDILLYEIDRMNLGRMADFSVLRLPSFMSVGDARNMISRHQAPAALIVGEKGYEVASVTDLARLAAPHCELGDVFKCVRQPVSTDLTVRDAYRSFSGQYSHVIVGGGDQVGLVDVRQLREVIHEFVELASQRQQIEVRHVAHDLRAPLSAMQAFAEMLKTDPGEFSAEDASEFILSASIHLQDMLDSFQKWEAIPSSAALVSEASNLFDSIASTYSKAAKAKDIELNVASLDPGIVLRCDAGHALRLLSNAVNNAITYCPPKSSVEVQFEKRGQKYVVSVSDNGPGMDATESVSTRLGLRIMHYLARLNGVLVDIESGAGAGTTVQFSFDPARVPLQGAS